MQKKSKNSVIVAVVLVLAVLIGSVSGIVAGLIVLNGKNGGEQVTDAFCKLIKTDSGEFCFHIPKLDIDEEWVTDINKEIYDTLYDEYEKGVLAFENEDPAISSMEYEWAKKDDIISITVQIKNDFTDKYEFFVFNIDTGEKRKITSEELLSKLGLNSDEFYDKIKNFVKENGENEKDNVRSDDSGRYEILLENSIRDSSIRDSLVFIDKDGAVCVIAEIFDALANDNVLKIISADNGTIKDYFKCEKEKHEAITSDNNDSEDTTEETDPEKKERLELNDSDIDLLIDYLKASLGVDEYNYETTDFGTLVENIIFDPLGLKNWYEVIYGVPEVVRLTEEADPLNRFSRDFPDYMVAPEENVRWICENVFHKEYDASYKSDRYYAHEGKVYYLLGYAGDIPPEYSIVSNKALDDGRYEIILSSDWGRYERFLCDVREDNGKRYMSFYEIEYQQTPLSKIPDNTSGEGFSDADIKLLQEMYRFGMPDFNSNTSSVNYVIDCCMNNTFGPSTYDVYFDDFESVNAYMDPSNADPEGRFRAYFRLPVESVEWMLKNVYNLEFDENAGTEKFYIKDGYVYVDTVISGDIPPDIRLVEQKALSDSRTLLIFNEYYYWEDEPSKQVRIIAEMKNVDGKRVCSLYDVQNKNLR